MAQYKTDSQEYTSNGGSTFETQLLATKNGQVIDESNPTLGISLAAEDELEIMVAASSTNLALDSAAATSFAPATASALVSVTQVQL